MVAKLKTIFLLMVADFKNYFILSMVAKIEDFGPIYKN